MPRRRTTGGDAFFFAPPALPLECFLLLLLVVVFFPPTPTVALRPGAALFAAAEEAEAGAGAGSDAAVGSPPASIIDSADGTVVRLSRPVAFRDLPWHGDGAVLLDDGAAFLEVRVAALCLADGETLAFYDADGIERDRIGGCRNGPTWTNRVGGGEVRVRLERDDGRRPSASASALSGGQRHAIGPRRWDKPQHQAKADIDAYVRGDPPPPPNPFRLRTICGTNESRDAKCYDAPAYRAEYSFGRAVLRVRVRTETGSNWCTGFLVSRANHFLTNEHCVNDDYSAANSDYEWGSENPGCGDGTANGQGWHKGEMKVRGKATLLQHSATMDYALLRLDAAALVGGADPAREYGYLDVSPSAPAEGEALYVPHHPNGRAREISVYSSHAMDESGRCEVYTTNCCSVKYFCDTDGGSSGSPVLSRDRPNEVETIHSSGNSPCTSGNYGRIMGHVYGEIAEYVDECATDEECDDGDGCTIDMCDGTPRRCRNGAFRDGCCGNGKCEDGESCGTCPADCCEIHSLNTLGADDGGGAAGENATAVSHGVMFDVESATGAAIDLLELRFRPHYGGYSEISIYAKEGTWLGSENAPADWTHLGSSSVLLTPGEPIAVPASIVGRNRPLAVPGGGSTTAIYVRSSASRLELLAPPAGPGGLAAGDPLLRSDGLLALFAGAAARGHELGTLEVSPDPRGFVGELVYRVRSAGAQGSIGRPGATAAAAADGIATLSPTGNPTGNPTSAPSRAPTTAPTTGPTPGPTAPPTDAPASAPTKEPTAAPTATPTGAPTAAPSPPPTMSPAASPSSATTSSPTSTPADGTIAPTAEPSDGPTPAPSGPAPAGSPTFTATTATAAAPSPGPVPSPPSAAAAPTSTSSPSGPPAAEPAPAPGGDPARGGSSAPAGGGNASPPAEIYGEVDAATASGAGTARRRRGLFVGPGRAGAGYPALLGAALFVLLNPPFA